MFSRLEPNIDYYSNSGNCWSCNNYFLLVSRSSGFTSNNRYHNHSIGFDSRWNFEKSKYVGDIQSNKYWWKWLSNRKLHLPNDHDYQLLMDTRKPSK